MSVNIDWQHSDEIEQADSRIYISAVTGKTQFNFLLSVSMGSGQECLSISGTVLGDPTLVKKMKHYLSGAFVSAATTQLRRKGNPVKQFSAQ